MLRRVGNMTRACDAPPPLQEFVKRSIWQATPVVGVHNTIVMTLSPSFNIYGADDSYIFITELKGSGLPRRVKIASTLQLFCLDDEPGYAGFDAASATLYMQVCPGAEFRVGDEAVVAFNVTNPTNRQASPDVFISANGSSVFLTSPMAKSGAQWGSVAGGHDPLMVVTILRWTFVNVTAAPSKGGAMLELRGQLFPSSFGVAALPYQCSFERGGQRMLTSAVVVRNGSALICPSPFSQVQQLTNLRVRYNGQEMDFDVPVALKHDDVLLPMAAVAPKTFLVSDGWEHISATSPSRGPADGGTVITILGYGFNWEKGYKCRFFTSSDASGFLDTGASIRSPTTLTCRTPVWGLKHAAETTAINIVRLDGGSDESIILFTNQTVDGADSSQCRVTPQYGRCAFAFEPVWSMTGETNALDLPPSRPAVFSAAGGDEFMVSGMGFANDSDTRYVCRFVFRYGPFEYAFASPYPARFVNHTLIVCITPVWKYYYTEEAIMELDIVGQGAVVAMATHAQPMAFTFREVYYALEPTTGSAAGGYRVTVRGMGFNQGEGYRLRRNGVSVASSAVSSGDITFIMPSYVGADRVVNFTLQYADVNPILQGAFVRLLPDAHPSPDSATWSGVNGDCTSYTYGNVNWNRCKEHGACAPCNTSCASECGWLAGAEGHQLAFEVQPQWVRVDSPIMDPSQQHAVRVETYGIGPPHTYFAEYVSAGNVTWPRTPCNLSQHEPYLRSAKVPCPVPP